MLKVDVSLSPEKMPFEEPSTESCELEKREAYEEEGIYDVYRDEFDLGSPSTEYLEDINQLYMVGEIKG